MVCIGFRNHAHDYLFHSLSNSLELPILDNRRALLLSLLAVTVCAALVHHPLGVGDEQLLHLAVVLQW